MSDRQPEETLRDGNLKATLWRNEGENGPYFNVTIAKTYKDNHGKYQDTNSFSGTDLLRVSEISRQAYTRSSELRRDHYQSLDRGDRKAQSRESASGAFEQETGRPRGRGRAYSR